MSELTDKLWKFMDEVIESNTEADGTYILKHCIHIVQEYESMQQERPTFMVCEVVHDTGYRIVTEIRLAHSLNQARMDFAVEHDVYDEDAMADCPDKPEPCDPVYNLKNIHAKMLWRETIEPDCHLLYRSWGD